MKSLLLYLIVMFTVSAHAQNYFYQKDQCYTGETCLVTRHNVYKLIPIENRDGDIIVERVNTSSILSDIIPDYDPSGNDTRVCIQGSDTEAICKIGELLASNENSYYYQGGHSYIDSFKCNVFHSGHIVFVVEILHDWAPHFEQRSYSLRRCRD